MVRTSSTTARHLALGLLRCPWTRAPLTFVAAVEQPFGDGGFGLLVGGAGPYPVVDGVPVLRHGRIPVQNHVSGAEEAPGPEVADLVALIGAGRSLDALLELLVVTPSPQLRGRHVPGSGRLLGVPALARLARRARVRVLRGRLAHGRRDGSLAWWAELFHTRSRGVDDELLHYFRHRGVQPRYLAAHAALRPVLGVQGPVLDLACGYGHLAADVLRAPGATGAAGAAGRTVVGVDRTFFQLWLATHRVAPGGLFVCADAAGPLPLADGAVRAAFCSDAFHLLPGQDAVLAELFRVCPEGPVVLTRLGNLDHEPHEGHERTASGWEELVADRPHLVAGEQELLHHYLEGTPVVPGRGLAGQKWLSVVLGSTPGPAAPEQAPHSRGRLRINPLYARTPRPDGSVELHLEMPSPWFAFENDGLRAYHAASATISAAGRRTPELADLAERFVVLGG